ncbi:hypothetical protein [Sulfurovum sp. NBC37-1]|uniref:hypothetical protein n=1 Tax=Sulfurovum sp. (strain NBC37-1) TaxID=387093 RepID=UPI00015879E3|nr:hypothetical protein [Sulfurovum sp. NBC37-1]BAF72395.1 hypothetical protein SUN_1444 [Sulfurovum sp. NBC37-1]
MSRRSKEFNEYLIDSNSQHNFSHNDYMQHPAIAFLKYTVEAKDAVNFCINKFPKNNDNEYSKDSLDSLQHIVVAMLPTLMGHFETYQRYLFALMFDYSIYLKDFDVENFFKKINKSANLSIDLIRLSSYRGSNSTSIGLLLSDSLPGWHNPSKVNSYFSAFDLNFQLFNANAEKQLRILWQLRHSIVHTGGTITVPDAQKVPELKLYGKKQVVFEKNFIFEVARKIHPLIKDSTTGIGEKFIEKLIDDITDEQKEQIEEIFKVRSSVAVWLR